MILTKQQIQKIEYAWKQAQKAQDIADEKMKSLNSIIVDITGIKGNTDYLAGDGFGFTPESNDDTHIYVGDLLDFAREGSDITEGFILDNLSL